MAERTVQHIRRSAAGEDGTYTTVYGERICFRGFRSKTKAKAYIRARGGVLCYAGGETGYCKNKREYMQAVLYGGMDAERFPCCVQWKE